LEYHIVDDVAYMSTNDITVLRSLSRFENAFYIGLHDRVNVEMSGVHDLSVTMRVPYGGCNSISVLLETTDEAIIPINCCEYYKHSNMGDHGVNVARRDLQVRKVTDDHRKGFYRAETRRATKY
jgi:hypothetical protein